jgi:hypothetical protein
MTPIKPIARSFLGAMIALFTISQSFAQDPVYVPCNGLAYFIDDLSPTNLNSCVGTSPTLTARIHPAWDLEIPGGGSSNIVLAVEHEIGP